MRTRFAHPEGAMARDTRINLDCPQVLPGPFGADPEGVPFTTRLGRMPPPLLAPPPWLGPSRPGRSERLRYRNDSQPFARARLTRAPP